jgi:cytochrome c oxidase subunit 2
MRPDPDAGAQARRPETGPRATAPGPLATGYAPGSRHRGAARHVARGGRIRRAASLAACLAVALLASGCVRQGISPKAAGVHRLFYIILWLALPVFVFVEGMLLVSIVRFRKRHGDESPPPQTSGSRVALTAFFAGPLAVIIALLVFGESAVARVNRDDPHPTEQLVVTGFQWEWSAHYINEGVTVTGKTLKQAMTMELPVNAPARIDLRSSDVIHEFYVPDLLFMKNAVPGHPNVFTLTPTKVGTYHGQCAQFCGLWHSKMELVLKIVPQAEFQSWVAQQKQAASNTGSCTPTGSTATLVANQISWDKSCIAVVAGKPFQITINNQDKRIAHNFAVYDKATLAHQLYLSPDVTGPDTKTFAGPALSAGTYYFQCDIHGPAMAGTLIVR